MKGKATAEISGSSIALLTRGSGSQRDRVDLVHYLG